MGGALSMMLLNRTAPGLIDAEGMLYGMNTAGHAIDIWIISVAGATGCLLTGLLYALLTPWGFFKHRWVALQMAVYRHFHPDGDLLPGIVGNRHARPQPGMGQRGAGGRKVPEHERETGRAVRGATGRPVLHDRDIRGQTLGQKEGGVKGEAVGQEARHPGHGRHALQERQKQMGVLLLPSEHDVRHDLHGQRVPGRAATLPRKILAILRKTGIGAALKDYTITIPRAPLRDHHLGHGGQGGNRRCGIRPARRT